MLQKLIQTWYVPKMRRINADIGCKLVFHNIPDDYIQGIVNCDMTPNWKKFGLTIDKGANYFTFGHVVNGDSTRYDPDAAEYQSWLGGYTVKLSPGTHWALDEYFKLAIADQNSWLRRYGDQHPMTTMEGWQPVALGPIQIGEYSGQLYEFGCTTHSDVGRGSHSLATYLAALFMSALFNLSNPQLNLKPRTLWPISTKGGYKTIKLKGHVALFEVNEQVKVVLYANGAIIHKAGQDIDTFETLKSDLLTAMEFCEIVTI